MIRAILALMILQTTGASPLVGRWDAEARSRGGLGTWIELADRGACSQTTGAMVDGTWKLDGDQFTVSIPIDIGAPVVQRGTSTIHGNMQTQVLEGQNRQLTRRGAAAPGQPPIVGVWTYPHLAGKSAYDEYKPDGRFLIRLPMTSMSCRWTVDADRLRMTIGAESQDLRWHIVGDRLTLDGPDGSQTFRRERAGVIPPALGR